MGKLLPEVGLPQQGAELFHHQMQTNITAFNNTCGTTELLSMMGETGLNIIVGLKWTISTKQ